MLCHASGNLKKECTMYLICNIGTGWVKKKFLNSEKLKCWEHEEMDNRMCVYDLRGTHLLMHSHLVFLSQFIVQKRKTCVWWVVFKICNVNMEPLLWSTGAALYRRAGDVLRCMEKIKLRIKLAENLS